MKRTLRGKIHKALWYWLHKQTLTQVQRYEMENLTDYDFLERVSLEYED